MGAEAVKILIQKITGNEKPGQVSKALPCVFSAGVTSGFARMW
jgi:hypothetical protein